MSWMKTGRSEKKVGSKYCSGCRRKIVNNQWQLHRERARGGATWQRRVQIRAICLQPPAGEVNRCGNIRRGPRYAASMGAAPPHHALAAAGVWICSANNAGEPVITPSNRRISARVLLEKQSKKISEVLIKGRAVVILNRRIRAFNPVRRRLIM